ncbi:MAG: molybdopterin-synthase adenylyltransferase MoeB [Cellvibrionaceae bacterium]
MSNDSSMNFSGSEWLRYTRHLQLPQFGVAGQKRLKDSRVLIIGAGGLGSPVSLYLAAAGVGHITIVDGDQVDLTNLQRQIIFSTDEVGQAKAGCAKKRLLALNPEINVTAVEANLTIDNAVKLIAAADMVLDCTDNFSTRYLINDTCVQLKKPWVFASIYQFSGQCALFTPATACFRCLFPDAPENIEDCNTAGVLGVLPGLLGTLQASEAIKFLAGLPTALENKLCMLETMDLSMNKIQLAKNTDCPVCSATNDSVLDTDYTIACNFVADTYDTISTVEFAQHLSSAENNDSYIILDVRSEEERINFHLGGLHIPINEINNNTNKLPKEKLVLCYCQTGVRSQKAVAILNNLGFKAKSLHGGIVDFLKSEV